MLAPLGLAVSGLLFLLYPALRPWTDESTAAGAIEAMSSDAWVASHLFAMLGFILMPLGLLAVHRAAAIVGWLGAGLVLPYYGAEDFGLHEIATQAAENGQIDILAVADAVRYNPVAVATFLIGLLLLAACGIMTAVAVWRSATLPRFSGVLFGLGFVLFLPQFFTPAPVRIGHGMLIAIGSLWLAAALWRADAGRRTVADR